MSFQTPSTSSAAVIIRRKTVQILNLDKKPDLRNAIAWAAGKFRKLDMPKATHCAMQLLYTPAGFISHPEYEKFLNMVGLTVHSEKSFGRDDLRFVEPESVSQVVAELVFQYHVQTPKFLDFSLHCHCEKELSALESNVGDEPVLIFCIKRMLNGEYKKDSSIKLVTQLREDSEDIQKAALFAMKQNPLYAGAMLPHACYIADLLSAMHEQYKKQQELVARLPQYESPVPQEAIREEVPKDLLTDVPELADLAAYIPYLGEIIQFFEDFKDVLPPFIGLAKYGFSINAFLNDPNYVPRLGNMDIPATFKRQSLDLAAKIPISTVDTLIINSKVLPTLFPAYNALKTAFSATANAQGALAEKHRTISDMVPNISNPAFGSAVHALSEATQAANEANQKYKESVLSFKRVISNHPLMSAHKQ